MVRLSHDVLTSILQWCRLQWDMMTLPRARLSSWRTCLRTSRSLLRCSSCAVLSFRICTRVGGWTWLDGCFGHCHECPIEWVIGSAIHVNTQASYGLSPAKSLCSRRRDASHMLPRVPAVQHGQRVGAGKVLRAHVAAQHAGMAQQAKDEGGRWEGRYCRQTAVPAGGSCPTPASQLSEKSVLHLCSCGEHCDPTQTACGKHQLLMSAYTGRCCSTSADAADRGSCWRSWAPPAAAKRRCCPSSAAERRA